ncbi:MAG: hypothetical protein RR607_06490, partial [Akkermansia sp.]
KKLITSLKFFNKPFANRFGAFLPLPLTANPNPFTNSILSIYRKILALPAKDLRSRLVKVSSLAELDKLRDFVLSL